MYNYVLICNIYIYTNIAFLHTILYTVYMAFKCVIPRLFRISRGWVPGKLQEKVKTLEKESLRKDEALDDAQHQLQAVEGRSWFIMVA